MSDFKQFLNESGRGQEIFTALKGTKNSVGSDLGEQFTEYQRALLTVAGAPSMMKDYLEEVGVELSKKEKDTIDKAIDASIAVLKVLK